MFQWILSRPEEDYNSMQAQHIQKNTQGQLANLHHKQDRLTNSVWLVLGLEEAAIGTNTKILKITSVRVKRQKMAQTKALQAVAAR